MLDGVPYEVNNDIALWVKLLLKENAFYAAKKLSKFRVHDVQRSADVREMISGTLEWSRLLRAALAHHLVVDHLTVQVMYGHIHEFTQLGARSSAARPKPAR